MSQEIFGDLLLIRKGGPAMTHGGGSTTVEPATAPEEWSIKAEALRDIFRQTLGEQPPIDCPLDMKVEYERDEGTHLERRISYQVEPDERVASLALIPKGLKGRAPGVLCIHQTQAIGKEDTVGRNPEYPNPENNHCAYGWHLVQRGFVTFAPDLLGSGERIYPGRKHFDNEPFYAKHPRWSGTGKDLWDMGRALDVLLQQPEVDPQRIGSIGHSQGAGITVYLMAIDPRIKVGVSNCGLWPMRIIKNPFNVARTGWWIGRPALRPFCWAGKQFPIDVHELFALAAPRPLLNITALNDFQFTPEEEAVAREGWHDLMRNVNKVYELLGAPSQFRCLLHLRGHHFHADMREIAYALLKDVLKPGQAS